MKRALSLLLAMIMFITLSITAFAATSYKDVTNKHWAYHDIVWATEQGLMNGTGSGKFSPNASMTRAMVVTVLYRMEGSPEVEASLPFSDIKENWYRDAVKWAYKNDIVNGTSNTTFAPNKKITREQIATILYRYCEYLGNDVSATANLGKFSDSKKVGTWAKTALQWAYAVGLITGTTKNGTTILDPQGVASRAQVSAILHRYHNEYGNDFGKTWIVDGEWEFTINSVTVHNLCNSVSNRSEGYTNEQVILIEYTYKNIGYSRESIDLWFYFTDFDVYDETGESADHYSCTHEKNPKQCSYGKKCTASVAFVLKNNSTKITVNVSQYKSKVFEKEQREFVLDWSPKTTPKPDSGSTPALSPVERLGEYIINNGTKTNNGYGMVVKTTSNNYENTSVMIIWYPEEQRFTFGKVEEMVGSKSTVAVELTKGQTKANITYGYQMNSNTSEMIGSGTINLSTYSSSNKKINGFVSNTSLSSFSGLVESGVRLLITEIGVWLKETGMGVTLNSLGFTNY